MNDFPTTSNLPYANYGADAPQPPQPEKPRWSSRKKLGVGAAVVVGLAIVGGAIGGGTSGNNNDKTEPAVSAQVKDHADYEVAQVTTPPLPPESTYDSNPGLTKLQVDNMFVDLLRDQGINRDRDTLIEAGRDGVCPMAAEVDNLGELALIVTAATGLNEIDAGFFIGASFAAYCPQFEYLVP